MLKTLPDPDRRLAAARELLRGRDADLEFETEPGLATEIAALGLWSEIGTPNDQISLQLVLPGTDTAVPLESARADLVEYRGNIGVRIRYAEHDRLTCKKPGLTTLLHPSMSFNADGTAGQVVLFPITVARIAKQEGADLVIVPSWALDTSFAGTTTDYYRSYGQPETWSEVLHTIDHFCELLEAHRIPFFTTHDLASHISGFKGEAWDLVGTVARRLRTCLYGVFGDCAAPPFQALVLPFMAAYLLDGLTQPVHGETERILVAIDVLVDAIAAPAFADHDFAILRRFPLCYWHVLQHMRAAPEPLPASFRDEIRALVDAVISEMRRELASS
jgi:hypothetical protein